MAGVNIMYKSISIMQPTFLPWVGFFDLIDQVDEFVYLDIVQFEKQSWQQRNRIIANGSLHWITVPVHTAGRFGQKINQVRIVKDQFPIKQVKTIEQNYSKARYFDHYWEDLRRIFYNAREAGLLGSLNIAIINWFVDVFEISTNVSVASNFIVSDGRERRLLDIIRKKNCTVYISPIGSAAYLGESFSQFNREGIDLYYQNYKPIKYSQQGSNFIPFASCLDLVFNEGPNSLEIIREGRMRKLNPGEVT